MLYVMNTVVVGIGNLLMGDDAVGVKVVEMLRQGYEFPPDVLIIDGGTKSIELLPWIEDARRVIFVDAVDLGDPPGTIREVTGEAVAECFENKLSVHQIGLPDLIGAMALRGTVPQEMVLIGIQPSSTDLQWGLTEEVSRAVRRAAEMVVARLRQWGLEVRDVSCDTI